MKKLLLLTFAVCLITAASWWMYEQSFDLNSLRAALGQLSVWQTDNATFLFVLFFVGYVVATAFSLPIATWLTLGAGALFGFWQGLLLVSFASTIGSTIAFIASRYFFQDWVRARLGTRLAAIDDGVAKDGAFYLFSLRLIPVAPFFAVNLLMGLTSIKTATFYVVSQIGMLPGTAAFVNAGTQLASLESLSGILSPAVPLNLSKPDHVQFWAWVRMGYGRQPNAHC